MSSAPIIIPANAPVSPGGARGIMGLRGAPGETGLPGPQGPIGNFNRTDAPFVVPIPGATVEVPLLDASWASIGQMVYVEWSGANAESALFQITAINGNEITLLNPVTEALGAPVSLPFRYLTAETTLTAADSGWYLICRGSASWRLSLPPAELALAYFIRNDMESDIITVLAPGGRIDEQPNIRLYPGQSCLLFTNGINWRTFGLRSLPFVIPESIDAGLDLIIDKLFPNQPCLTISYRSGNKRTLLSGAGKLGFSRGTDPDNPEAEAWIGLSDAGGLELDKPTRVQGQLTVTAGGAHITGGVTVPSGGANITGPVTIQTQGNWCTINNSTGAAGIMMNAFNDGVGNTYRELLRCNPNWDNMTLRCWHAHGSWAGFSMHLGGNFFRFDNSGSIWRNWDGATVQWVASDAAMKRDIGPWEADALAILRKIPIQAYTQIKDGVRRAIGWVAQSVEKVAPDWVQESKGSDVDGNEMVRKRVEPNDQGLPYLIRAIQQLDEHVTKIEERLTKLEANNG